MIEILSAPENVAAFRLAGTVSERDYEELIREVEGKLKSRGRIGIYVDATDYRRMTFPALRKRLRYGVKSWHKRSSFPRTALVTDKRWMSSLTRAADKLIPEIKARAFKPQDSDGALRWVATGSEAL